MTRVVGLSPSLPNEGGYDDLGCYCFQTIKIMTAPSQLSCLVKRRLMRSTPTGVARGEPLWDGVTVKVVSAVGRGFYWSTGA